jgi:PAS domain S-box-containing protein
LESIHPDDRTRVLEAALTKQVIGAYNEEYRIVRPDGTVRWIWDRAFPVCDGSGRVYRIAGCAEDITERKRAEEALRSSVSTLNSLVEHLQSGVLFEDTDRRIIFVNHTFCTMFGIPHPQVLVGVDCREAAQQAKGLFADPEQFVECIEEIISRSEYVGGRELALRDGRIVEQDYVPVFINNALSGHLWLYRDVTEHKHLEEQLRQAQKMEAIGRLTGSIAHDFNNLLTVISGYSTLLLRRLKPGDRLHRFSEEIMRASERARGLTQQLLAFSRRQILEPRVLNLNRSVAAMNPMLRRLIGEDIDLVTLLSPELGPIRADVGQIEQVIMNLAVNARDAMPQGGKLTIETANAELDEAYASRHIGIDPGLYVLLAITDTGQGMDMETRAHLFEPFFTTKAQGKGTGLGLATVYGIVKQSGGHIFVDSEPGRGTTFKIYFPRTENIPEAEQEPPPTLDTEGIRGSETILLVEDEEAVRELARETLEEAGFHVLEAQDGATAIARCSRYEGPIHLLVTDVVMPGMDGRTLAKRLTTIHPNMKVLYMSGYTDDTLLRRGIFSGDLVFLQKPFTPFSLACKVREVLNAPSPPG